ncbi:hypothetical protein IJ843_01095 [bacterium]|nr:hypothetical protein [bacterium]
MEKRKKLIITSVVIAIILVILAIVFAILNKDNYKNERNEQLYIENNIIKSFHEARSLDNDKPTLVLFYGNYCINCHKFMPFFNKLSKDYGKKYNFLALNIQDPANYPLVSGNVGAIPTLVIFDTSIGNKIHISLPAIRSYNDLKAELDRYLRIRSYIDLDKAKNEHQNFMEEYLIKTQKEDKI